MATSKKRRSDFAVRLGTRRTEAVEAFCKADRNCSAKGFEAQAKHVAKIAGVTPTRIKAVCGGRSDLGRQATYKLEAHLQAQSRDIRDHTTNDFVKRSGVWIFADPNGKELFMPLALREDRMEVVRALMIEYVRKTRGKKASIDDAIAIIAEDTGLAVNSVDMVSRSVSYMGSDRLAAMCEKFVAAGGTAKALALLGENPQDWSPGDVTNGNATDTPTIEVDSEEEPGAAPPLPPASNPLQTLGLMLTTLNAADHLLVSGNGESQLLSGEQDVVVIVRRGQPVQVISPPAGAEFGSGQVLKGSSPDAGMVSITFSPAAKPN